MLADLARAYHSARQGEVWAFRPLFAAYVGTLTSLGAALLAVLMRTHSQRMSRRAPFLLGSTLATAAYSWSVMRRDLASHPPQGASHPPGGAIAGIGAGV
jgi:hypothetical protein